MSTVAPIQIPATPVPVEVPATPSKVDRKQASQIVDITMSVARVKHALADGAINGPLKKAVEPYKKMKTNYEAATKLFAQGGEKKLIEGKDYIAPIDDNKREQLQADIAVYTGKMNEIETAIASAVAKRIRFSNDSSIALAVVCNALVSELSFVAITKAQADGHTIIKPDHIYSGDIKSSYLYGLVSQSQLFNKHSEEVADKLASQSLETKLEKAKSAGADSLLKSLSKDLRSKIKAELKAMKTLGKPSNKVIVTHHTEVEDSSKFGYYVAAICKEVANKVISTEVRVSGAFKAHVSALVEDFINRVAAPITVLTEASGNKTVTQTSVMQAVKLMLANGVKYTAKYEDGETYSPAAVAGEKANAKAAKLRGEKYVLKFDHLPKVNGKMLKVSAHYGNNYEKLAQFTEDKMKKFADRKKKESTPAVAAEVAAPAVQVAQTAQPEGGDL